MMREELRKIVMEARTKGTDTLLETYKDFLDRIESEIYKMARSGGEFMIATFNYQDESKVISIYFGDIKGLDVTYMAHNQVIIRWD